MAKVSEARRLELVEQGKLGGRPPGRIEDSTAYAKAAKLFTAQLVAENLEQMLRAQIRKAIDESDTAAFIAVMDRAHGKPAQAVEVGGEGGQPIVFMPLALIQKFALEESAKPLQVDAKVVNNNQESALDNQNMAN